MPSGIFFKEIFELKNDKLPTLTCQQQSTFNNNMYLAAARVYSERL